LIRLTRLPDGKGRPDRIVTSGELVAELADNHEGWGQVCRAARAAGLAPPEVDPQTGEFVFASKADAAGLWRTNVQTQIDNRLRALAHVQRAEDNLLRLGVEQGADGRYTLPPVAERAPSPARASAPASPPPPPPPAATVAAPEPTPAEAPEPRLRVELVTEEQAIAIGAVMAAARAAEPVQWFKLGVCMLVVEGRQAALAIEGLPEKAFAQLKTMPERQARDQALKWAAEVVR
jgi:hypothetical protein